MKKLKILFLALLSLVVLSSCEKDKVQEPTGVTMNKPTLALQVGAEETLTATIKPENATNKKVTWESNNKGVATVDATGKVKAIKAGEATITVTTEDGGKTAECVVTVTTETLPAKVLESITAPDAVTGLTNGISAADVVTELPATVTMVTTEGSVPANVTWTAPAVGTYDPATKVAQTFNVAGTVALPDGVINTNSVPLTVSVSVTVDAPSIVFNTEGATVNGHYFGLTSSGDEQDWYLRLTEAEAIVEDIFTEDPENGLVLVLGLFTDLSHTYENGFPTGSYTIDDHVDIYSSFLDNYTNGVNNVYGILSGTLVITKDASNIYTINADLIVIGSDNVETLLTVDFIGTPTTSRPKPPVVGIQTETETANCYIVPVGGTGDGIDTKTTTLRFPAVTRVNEFWTSTTGSTGTGDAKTYPYGYATGDNNANKIVVADQWYAEVIWADFNYTDKVTITQTETTKGSGLGNLEVVITDAPTNGGNVVVGLKKGDGTAGYLWSWHIWISDVGRTANVGTNAFTINPTSGAKNVMDRNLGALSAGRSSTGTNAFGLYYQWGRKDAFPTAGATTGNTESDIWTLAGGTTSGKYGAANYGDKVNTPTTLDASIVAPLTFNGGGASDWVSVGGAGFERFDRWNVLYTYDADSEAYFVKGEKSIFDPCPPGWRVPWGEDWSGIPAGNNNATTAFPWTTRPNGRTLTAAGADKGWFPASGWRTYSAGVLEYVGTLGFYWSGTPSSATSGYNLSFSGSGVSPSYSSQRSYGMPVRPVQDIP